MPIMVFLICLRLKIKIGWVASFFVALLEGLICMINYTKKKRRNQGAMFGMDKYLSKNAFDRFCNCGNTLSFAANEELEKKKLLSGDFCKNRFCPMCAWRQARKDAIKITMIMKYIEILHEKCFVFLTLTAPNVKGDNLISEIDRYNLAFKNLMKRKEVLPVNKGYIRKLEITYDSDEVVTYDMWHGNSEKHIKARANYYEGLGLKIGDVNPNYNTYHPHFHVVIAVNKSYFTDKTYIKHDMWLNMWRSVMDDDRITQVMIEKVKKNEANKQVYEIAKYAVKDSEMTVNQEVFDYFYNALKGRQVLTYNGLFKDVNKLYKLFLKKRDEECCKDIFYKFMEIDETEYIYFLLYRWGQGDYVQAEFRELTEEERKKINKKIIDETLDDNFD